MLGRRAVSCAFLAAATVPMVAPPAPSFADAPVLLRTVAYADLEPVKPTSKRLILVRHGETLPNRLGLPQGRYLDVGLDDVGHRQAAAAGRAFAQGPPIAVVGSSRRLRAMQTADAICQARAPARVREGPREDLDEVEGLVPPTEVTRAYVDTRMRAFGALVQIQRALQPGEAGVWVTHSRFLRVVLAAAAAEEAKAKGSEFLEEWKQSFPPGFDLSNAGISCIDVSEGGVFSIRCVNAEALG
jgi:broad specificity phosphatase PhoE